MSPAEPITMSELRWWWVPDAAFAALRAFAALLLVRHALQDLFGLFVPAGATWLGTPGALTDRWIAASLELLGGALLVAGLFTRVAAVVLLLVVLLSTLASPRAGGLWIPGNGELVALLAALLVFFAVAGGGLFSLDTPRSDRPRRRGRAMTVRMSPWLERQYRHREHMR